MKKIITTVCLIFLSQVNFGQINSKLISSAEEILYTSDNKPGFVKIKQSAGILQAEIEQFINSAIFNNGKNKVSPRKTTERNKYGLTHIKFDIFQNGVLVTNKVIIAHCKNGKLVSLNGDLDDIKIASNNFSLSEAQALNFALNKVNAKKYKWENKGEEQQMREALNDPNFTYYPHAEKVIIERDGNFYYAYQFNIYADQPLYRANVFVDGSNGKVLDEQNLICTTDVPGQALTKYSGTQTITVDFTGTHHRLYESQRGAGWGMETRNMNNGMSYSAATDFTNATATWTSTGFDQAAIDAHWGAEKTYDYYFQEHNRNSINDNGLKLLSFIHYQSNFSNAFWDGQRMTYGDGDGFTDDMYTALDVCGHEITHGLTGNTAALTYTNESGALNESYSDIFGTAIENFARPGNWNWTIGEDLVIGPGALRSMSNPSSFGDPDTYLGTNYYIGTFDNGGVHTNSGVNNFWFYLLTTGGNGTNDVGSTYSVTGIGMTDAAKIAFEALTVYFTPNTNYMWARMLTIQAAKDLFGDCSNQVIQTTKAWYAVGVGADYIQGLVGPNFTTTNIDFCAPPANVTFSNTTINGVSYTWDFGDGTSANTTGTTSAFHSYTAVGAYNVKLKAIGCGAQDSITKTSYIVINPPVPPPVTSNTSGCAGSSVTLTATGSSVIRWYNSPSGGMELGSGSTYITPSLFGSSAIYYAANTLTLAPVVGGKTSNTGGGYISTNVSANYLIFSVIQPGVLNSVVMYANASQTRDVELRDFNDAVLYTTQVSLTTGTNVVTLNFPLTPGAGYRLGLAGGGPNAPLYRSNTGVTYPYNIANCVSITGSSGGTPYYYFYNWSVSKQGCSSSVVAITVPVNPLPSVTYTTSAAPSCMGDVINLEGGAPSGGVYSGTGVSGSSFNSGGLTNSSYTVTYTYTDNNGCSASAKAGMALQECTGISHSSLADNSVSIYPNPATDKFIVRSDLENLKITIMDATGRLLVNRDLAAEKEFKLDGFASGIYIVTVKDSNDASIKTVKLIKQ